MRPELDRLLDIAGARRPGDGVDRARHAVLAEALAQLDPHLLVAADDVGLAQHDDVGIGQKIEAHRMVGTGRHDDRPGLGDAGEGAGDRHLVAAARRAASQRQHRLARPVVSIELG